jgi:hypothetical protein
MPLFSKKRETPAKPSNEQRPADPKNGLSPLKAKKKAEKQAEFNAMLDEEEEELKKRNANYAQVSAYQKSARAR